MNVSVSLVNVCVLMTLAALCVVVAIAMRGHRAIAWLAASLMLGSSFVVALAIVPGSATETAIGTIALPAGYWSVARAIRAAYGQRAQFAPIAVTLTLLAMVQLLLLTDGWFEPLRATLFYVSCLIAASESVFRLLAHRRESPIDRALFVAFCAVMIPFAVRIPFLILYPASAISGGPQVIGGMLGQWVLATEGVLTVLSAFLILGKVIGQEIAEYRTRSERDDLTGLFNRHAFEDHVARCPARNVILLCDIDHFKRVNDRFGHAVGDQVIRDLASLLRETGFCAARLGGEEFALLLPDTGMARAVGIAHELKHRFYAMTHGGVDSDAPISTSIGLAEQAPGERLESALRRADAALYSAKREGRNRVVIFTPGMRHLFAVPSDQRAGHPAVA